MTAIPDQVFCLHIGGQPVWKAIVDGQIVPAEWNCKGAAEAGINVERRRQKAQRDAKAAGLTPPDFGIDATIALAAEFGFRGHERGWNLIKTQIELAQVLKCRPVTS